MLAYKQLYIFVEGTDDQRIFAKIFKPLLLNKYKFVKIIEYATLNKQVVKNFVRTFKSQAASEYLFVCDFDGKGNEALCISKRKEKENKKFDNILDKDKILIVKEEIESWYLAGITKSNLDKFKIKEFKNTEQIDKEQFKRLIPKQFQNKTDFLIEILKAFNIEEGKNKNNSMNYFVTKFELAK